MSEKMIGSEVLKTEKGNYYKEIIGNFEKKNFENSKERAAEVLGSIFKKDTCVSALDDALTKEKNLNLLSLGDFSNLGNPVSDKAIDVMLQTVGVVDDKGDKVGINDLKELMVDKTYYFGEGGGELRVERVGERDFNLLFVKGLERGDLEEVLKNMGELDIVNKIKSLTNRVKEVTEEEEKLLIDSDFDEEDMALVARGLSFVRDDEDNFVSGYGIKKKFSFIKREGGWDLVLDVEAMKGREKEAFIYTGTAENLINLFEESGLTIRYQLLGPISEGVLGYWEGKKYGNGFSGLTRRLSSYIGGPEGSNKDFLFDDFDDESRLKLEEGLLKIEDKAVEIVAKMILGLVGSGSSNADEKEYWGDCPLSMGGDGACEDSEGYLAFEDVEGSVGIDDDFVYYYKRGGYGTADGYFMAMSRKEMSVKGVPLPAGYLCRVSKEGAVKPIRVSMFAFEEEDSRRIFGSQFRKFEKDVGSDEVERSFARIREYLSK